MPGEKVELHWSEQNISIPWIYIGPTKETDESVTSGQWLLGYLVEKDAYKRLEETNEQFCIYQVGAETGTATDDVWKQIFSKNITCAYDICKVTSDIKKVLPHPTVFLRPPGWTTLQFLTHLVSTVNLFVPKIIGWHLNLAGSLFMLDMNSGGELLDAQWHYLDNVLVHGNEERYFFQRSTVSEQEIAGFKEFFLGQNEVGDKNAKCPDLLPAIKKYTYHGKSFDFHRLEMTYHFKSSETQELSLNLELRTAPSLPVLPLPVLTVQGVFQEWHSDDILWKIQLTDTSKFEKDPTILAYPQLPFAPSSPTACGAVYIKPCKGAKVLVTIPHGGVPTAMLLSRKDEEAEKNAVTIYGNTNIIGETKIEGQTTIIGETNIHGDTNINGNVTVG